MKKICIMYEHVNEPESTPEFITITTSVYHKPEVIRAVIENLEREVSLLNNMLEYAKKVFMFNVYRIN